MLRLFKNLTKTQVLFIIIALILVLIEVGLDLTMPEYMSEITRLVQTPGSAMSDIIRNGLYMLGCTALSLVCTVIVSYCAARIASSFAAVLRSKMFTKIESLGLQEIKKFSTSSLITRTTNDVTHVDMIIGMGLQMVARAPIMAIWAVMKIINKGYEWSMLTAACVVVLLITIGCLLALVLPRFEKVQKLIDKLNSVTRENLTGIRVIRAFNAEDYQNERFAKINNDLTDTQLFNQRVFAIMGPMMNLVMHALVLGIYIIGAILISKAGSLDKLTLFSNMVVFSSYGMLVITSFLMLCMIFMLWPRAKISANRINEVLDCKVNIKEGSFDSEPNEKGTIEFDKVSFKYPDADEYILKDISFKVNQGETVAIIGSTGSGKTTLINLIPRLYDTTEGNVFVDGRNVKEYKQSNLNNRIGYVPQKAVMFTGTVESNVAYGYVNNKKPTETNIEDAIRISQAKEFVDNMDGGKDAHIARGGTNISGGQKQRLAIARAIARNPEIYIFDDSFSALDYKTDSTLRKELKQYTKDATNIIVAQRIGTIINADKIIVLDEGKCVGMGTHEELLKNCEVYKEIALSQLSEEELFNA